MSEEGSPTFLNLRDFRMQKKPCLSHHRNTMHSNKSKDSTSTTTNNHNNTQTRRRIIVMSESESESDHQQTSPIKMTTDLKVTIAEKEKQMKFLMETFPKVDTMIIHDILSRYDFNSEEAAKEIARCHGGQNRMEKINYARWKQQYDTQKKLLTPSASCQTKRKFDEIQRQSSKKKKVKRKRTEDEDDSDDSSTSNQTFSREKVYDSDEDSDMELTNELTTDKKCVYEFFQNATSNELQQMAYCSKRKAELILELRPFTDWIDLVQKLENNKNLNTDLLNSAQQVLLTRNNIRHLMSKCNNLAQQLERAVAQGAGVKTQPHSLSGSLRLTSYQLIGLNWLAVLHAQGVNGILADEMGLGKTVQVISFLAYLKETGQACGTHLVIVPSSTLENWRSEFSRWCPELRVFMYYGSMEERRGFRIDFSKGILADFDVILTTYTLVANTPEERKMFRVTRMHYVIFDEAHMLKNMNTQRYENLIRINAKHRILLTGTPLQNNLLELMSLLIFVMPKMFAEKTTDLKCLFNKNSKNKDNQEILTFEREQVEQAKRIMKPFVLRRLKSDVLQDLPKKIDRIIEVPMVPTQKEQYMELIATYQKAADEELHSYQGLSIMSDLRKLANHPLLLRYHYDLDQLKQISNLLANDQNYKDTNYDVILEDLKFMSDFELNTMTLQYGCLKKFQLPDNLILTSGKFFYLDRILGDLKQNKHRVLIFSQYVIMLNVLESYMRLRKHRYLRLDGHTPVSERQGLIDQFGDDSEIFVFLLSTRAGGLGINLTSADTVIIHDIDFNPYNDKQAEDRCHRMGQARVVTVYRLISQCTIEEGMLAMNKEKLKLERDITTEEADNPDVKSVVRLLSTVLRVDNMKLNQFTSTKK